MDRRSLRNCDHLSMIAMAMAIVNTITSLYCCNDDAIPCLAQPIENELFVIRSSLSVLCVMNVRLQKAERCSQEVSVPLHNQTSTC